MQSITDSVVGTVSVRRHHNARGIRFKLSPKGELIATAPPRVPLLVIKTAIRTSRKQIASLVKEQRKDTVYQHEQAIGKSHRLLLQSSAEHRIVAASTSQTIITVTYPSTLTPDAPEVQSSAQKEVIRALKKEAKAYLTRRLRVLADRQGYDYVSIRYTHTCSRWGSCSSTGTISLNIALMKLPLELIDYVLIHELCHTKEMNHSERFWKLVGQADPLYRQHRSAIKKHSPAL